MNANNIEHVGYKKEKEDHGLMRSTADLKRSAGVNNGPDGIGNTVHIRGTKSKPKHQKPDVQYCIFS